MSALHEAWTSLRHGGNLLSPEALDALPQPGRATPGLADQLRAVRTALPPDRPATGEALSALLDVVLEETTGLHTGWRKGSAVGASEIVQLLDGTSLKPRRLWSGPDGEALAVFTTPETRIGVGRGRRPVAQVTEYLRRRNVPLGLLTNGREWRLIWADTDGLAWVEWDADRWLDADQLSPALHLLRLLLSWAALTRGKAEHPPLLVAIRDTRRGQGKLSKELGERVRRAVETLLRARRPVVAPAWEAHAAADLYVAACHVVMRLVVVLFAEARELLPCDNPVYHQAYGLRGMLDQLDRLSPERRRSRHSAWPRLLALFRLLHGGSPHPSINVLAYGGDLFKAGDPRGDGVQRALALLETLADPPDDDVLHRVLVLLTRTTQRVREGAVWRTVAAPVDFTELTSEYIGILYEGLLDYELHKAGDQPVVFLALGDQPALPLDRLEAMDDKALFALVEKAKVKRAAGAGEDDEGEEEAEEADEEAGDQPDEPVAAAIEEETPDDTRAAARARAIAWAERAAVVGKLVKAPRGKKGADDPAFREQLRAAASQLIADLELPGELYLVRWGGTRKGAGTFYTRPQLTLPTVRRTLEPLLRDEAGQIRTPEVLLALKICDPAMGSGSFLVAALRVLTAAVVESLHVHGRVVREGDRLTVDCAVLPEGDGALSGGNTEDLLDAIVRRAVVEHCLYGVDIDPLAVELARVSLWVETLDRRLPFTFLDHKLRCGDALVGTWLDRFRDYPLLAWDRQSPDLKWEGVHHPADQWHKALKTCRSQMISEQADLLAGKQVMAFAATSDEELKAAIERMRRLYRELRRVPAGRPDERARIWRDRIQADPALKRVREAFDTWCALWFWPLDRLADAPGPRTLAQPGEEALEVVRAVRAQVRFFHWELEFPDVFTEEGAGFHAVVGNPPWEIGKPSSKEFFSNHDPLYRAYGKQEGLRRQLVLFEEKSKIEEDWLAYLGGFKDRGNFVRNAAEPFGDVLDDKGKLSVALVPHKAAESLAAHKKWRGQRSRYHGTSDPAHPFRHQGSADLNTYKMFVEAGHALLRSGGQLGMVMPSGLYTDKGTGDLRKLLLERCAWRWLYGFENRSKVFDIDSRFKFCICIAQKGGETAAIQAAFMRHDLEDWGEAKGTLDYPVERVTAFSPVSLSVLEIRTARDLDVLVRIYTSSVLLGDDGPEGWGIRYAREFDMTNDSKLFPSRDRWEAKGYRPDGLGRWVGPDGDLALPLYEGRMIGQFDFSEKGWVTGKGRSAEWREILWTEKVVEPQYLMGEDTWLESLTVEDGEKARLAGTKLTFMAIGSATNRRSMFTAIVRDVPCGNAVPTLQPQKGVVGSLMMACSMNSFAYDFALRLRLGGLNLNYFVIAETPLLKESTTHTPVPGLAARLCLAHPWFAPTWIDLRRTMPGHAYPPRLWAITPHERLRLRAQLDAIVAALYGLDRADFAWILKDCDHPTAQLRDRAFCRTLDPKGFWRVDKDLPPEQRHTVLSLVAFDALQTLIAAHSGDRDAAIRAFCDQNDGDGWMLPDTLRLAEHGLGHDDRAQHPQPVASRLGPRFLDWQLAQTPEESWAECERHAKAILEGTPAPAEPPPSPTVLPERDLGPLFRKRS